MEGQVNASSSTIMELVSDIRNSIKEISSLNKEMSDNLDHLGVTFEDSGYEIVKKYVSDSQEKVEKAVPDLKIVMEKLIEYAAALKKSEEELKQ